MTWLVDNETLRYQLGMSLKQRALLFNKAFDSKMHWMALRRIYRSFKLTNQMMDPRMGP